MSSYRSVRDKSDLEAIHRRGVGFVMDPFNRRVHRAACLRILTLGLGEKKWFAEDEQGRDQYLAWRSGFRGAKRLEPCSICLGTGARTPLSAGSTSATPTTAGPRTLVAGRGYRVQLPETRYGAVEVWSSSALSFDNKPPWQKQLVQELREALKTLRLDHNSALHGTFAAEDAGSFDIENRLFYNVGSGAFPDAPPAVVFERLYGVPEAPGEMVKQYPYFAAYRSTPVDADFRHWQPRTSIARFNRIPVEHVTGDQASRLVWHAMCRASESITVEQEVQPIGRFGVNLKLHLPPGTSLKPVSVVKGIVDGVIGTFHQGCHPVDAARCAELLAPKLAPFGVSRRSLTPLLVDAQRVLLPGPAFKVHATWVQLDPLDELCDAGRLVVQGDADDQWPQLSGELFALSPRAPATASARGDA